MPSACLRLMLRAALAFVAVPFAAAVSPEEIRDRVHTELAKIASDPVLVAAVQAQNVRGQTLAQVKTIDATWMATPGVSPLMRQLMDSPSALRLLALRKTMPFLAECFVMDRLGANVAMTEKTSDYWQGDEAKFIECVKEGGRVWLGSLSFDDSTQTYSVQISLPVHDGGEVIGAVCFGIDVENL